MSKGKLWFALVVLFGINLLNFYDRIIPGAVGQKIIEEFKLSDTLYGLLGTAFIILYALVGVPLGRLADKFDRSKILTFGVTVWSILTAASGLAASFWQLTALRLAVGVGEASCAPAANSMIGDMFPAKKRAMALSLFMLGLPIGNALGLLISGIIAFHWSWRAAFYVALIPGLLCAVGAYFIGEPERGATETHSVGSKTRSGNPFMVVLTIPTMRWLIVAGALHNYIMYAIGSFLGPLLMRFYQLDVQYASYINAAVYGLAGIPGMILGGMLGDAIFHRRKNGRLLVAAFALSISAPCLWFALDQPADRLVAFSVLFGIGCMLLYVYFATVYSSIQDVIEPSLRGTAMAVYFCFMYLFGGFLGPLGVGLISDFYAERAAIADNIDIRSIEDPQEVQKALEPYKPESLRRSMYSLAIAAGFLGAVLFASSYTVTRDTENLQRWMKEQTALASASPPLEKVGTLR